MNRPDIGATTILNATSFAAGTATSAHQHDVMAYWSFQSTFVDAAPASASFLDTAMTTVGDYINLPAHGYQTGLLGSLTSTVALPSDFPTASSYYIIATDADHIQLADSLAHARAGTAIDITAKNGTGTHTFKPSALAGFSATFKASVDGATYSPLPGLTLTAMGSTMTSQGPVAYNYVKLDMTLTGGQITATVKARSVGGV